MTIRNTTKEDLRNLVDELPEGELHAARRYLEYLRDRGDPLVQLLENAPEDDELETEEERQAIAEGYCDLKAGRVVPLEQVKRELDL